MYYIYALVDPINKLPFYIGKGKGNRIYQHLNGKDIGNSRKVHYINNIRTLDHEPEPVIIKYFDDENVAYEWEYDLISYCVENEIKLTNRVGVDLRPPSRKGSKWSKESLDKRSKSLKKNRLNKPLKVISLETRSKISNTLKGRPKPNRIEVDIPSLKKLYIDQDISKNQLLKIFDIGMGTLNRILCENKIYKVPSLVKK
jgi:hypothetical protein